jgi:tRNA threonylcarbamoyladenosine biosynthesis protein TsaB
VTTGCGLAIEAATDELGLAACRDGRFESWSARPARGETERVYVHAEALLARLGASLGDLDFVAFGCGPGSFTGVRVAASVAQSIAFARAIPVCRVSSLAVLATGVARGREAAFVGVCLDARMGKVYAGLYRRSADGTMAAAAPEAWADPDHFVMPGSEAFVAAGDGWLAYPGLLERHAPRVLSVAEGILPAATDLLSMALADFRAGRTVGAEQALPEYLGQRPALPARPAK